MLRTQDGYRVTLPRFRLRRLRARTRRGSRLADLLIGRARRTSERPTPNPVFTTQLGRRMLWIVTRSIAPRRVELLYIRHGPRR